MYYIYYYDYFPGRVNGYVGVTQNIDQRHYHHKWKTGESLSLPKVLNTCNDKYKAEQLEKKYKKKYNCEDDRDSYTKTLGMQSRSHSVEANNKRSKTIHNLQRGKIREGLYNSVVKRRKPIVQLKDGKPIKIWESATGCSNITGISLVGIGAVIKGRQKTSHGYTFEYL